MDFGKGGGKGGGGMDFGALLGMMGDGIWEMPMIQNIAFHPRAAEAQYMDATSGSVRDGTFSVSGGDKVAYRLYLPEGTAQAVVFFFHGNAEICTDIAVEKDVFTSSGAALLSIDYRGYSWGTGQPSLTKLCGDTEACFKAADAVLEAAGCSGAKRIAMGRSIGATCAVHLASKFAADICGLVVDSGLMSIKGLPMVQMLAPQLLGPQGPQMLMALKEPFDTPGKLTAVGCPSLVMHGIRDEIVPISQGVDCHSKIPTTKKTLRQWENAGHNDVQMLNGTEWGGLISKLLEDAIAFQTDFPAGALVEAHSLSAADLNGQQGRVVGPQPEAERFRVQFADGEKALKPENLKVIERVPADPFPVGAIVEAHSLASAASYNGKQGKVVGMKDDRVRVEFDEGDEKALKPANLRRVDASSLGGKGEGKGYGPGVKSI